jgi:hypothetical protein
MMMTEKTRRRMVTVGLAPAAALVTWAGVRLAGADLALDGGRGSVGPVDVVAAALVAGVGAWWVVRLLERHTSRPRFWWPLLGSSVLGASLIGSSYLANGVDALGLYGLHIVTAMVLIWGLAATLPGYNACHRAHRSRA